MDTMEAGSFNAIVRRYLGRGLPDKIADIVAFPELSTEARGFILRMLALMQQAGYPPTEFTTILTRMLSDIIPNMLPSAWEGRIPPLTMPGRHQRFDDYVSSQTWPQMDRSPVFIDIGCGFPPVTTADTANCFPTWQIYGVDRFFARYVAYDQVGHYACFDQDGAFQYFQALMDKGWAALYAKPEATRKRFEGIFSALQPILTHTDDTMSETVDQDGCKLIQSHIRDYETDNLRFIESDIDTVQVPPARVIRCMNVLIYYKPQKRNQMLKSLGRLLCDGGILIAGTNGNNLQARYAVYRKLNDALMLEAFSFTLDNLRPFGVMPWFTIHDNDPEALSLAQLTGQIRADRKFWPEFSRRVDDLLSGYGIGRRAGDGFLQLLEPELPAAELIGKMRTLWQQVTWEGFKDGALAVLRQSGRKAWINPVGDISVQPSERANLAVSLSDTRPARVANR